MPTLLQVPDTRDAAEILLSMQAGTLLCEYLMMEKPSFVLTPLQSKDCQVADWADHKERCNLNAAATVNIKAESVELKTSGTTVPSSRGNASIDPRQLASDMKQWSQAHRGPLSLVAIHALRLDQDPKNLMKSVLNVFLSPSSRPAPYHLNLDDVVVAPLDEMAEICQVCS